MDFSAEQIRCSRNLLDIGRRYKALDGVPTLFHLLIPHQEAGWLEDNSGDAGQSHGPYQIYQVAHPRITRGVATDPGFDYGFWEIHASWGDDWQANGIDWTASDRNTRIAYLFARAPHMQGSIPWTMDNAVSAYDDSIAMLEMLT